MADFLNNNIKFLRTKNGISQQGLADKVGIDRSTVSRIENNEIETTIDNAIKIADALNVSLYDLVSKDLRTTNIETPPNKENHEKYKQLLKDKGLTDENITEEDAKKLIDFAIANKDFIIKKNKESEKK